MKNPDEIYNEIYKLMHTFNNENSDNEKQKMISIKQTTIFLDFMADFFKQNQMLDYEYYTFLSMLF